VDCNIIDQLLIDILHLSGKKLGAQQIFIDIKKAYDSFRWEVLYNILVEVVRLIKVCLNKIYCKIHIGKHFLFRMN
jgi:hypothetical protein